MSDDSELNAKREKAKQYAQEPERFTFMELSIEMESTHDTRHIWFLDGHWTCTCDFFQKANTCSHIMALQTMLADFRFDGTNEQ